MRPAQLEKIVLEKKKKKSKINDLKQHHKHLEGEELSKPKGREKVILEIEAEINNINSKI